MEKVSNKRLSHEQLNQIAIENGYSTLVDAVTKLGRFEWKRLVNKHLEKPIYQLDLPTLTRAIMHKKGVPFKQITFAPDYYIFEDGDLYSTKSAKFIKKRLCSPKNERENFKYELIKNKSFLVNRLVMFYFGNHSYTDINQMPKVMQIKNDVNNHHVSNLTFTTQKEINIMRGVKPSEKTIKLAKEKLAKIPASEIENVKKMLLDGEKQWSIAEKYNTTQTSVRRFIERHQIVIKKKTNFIKMEEKEKYTPPSREEILAFRIIEILKNEEFTKSQMQETLEHVKKNYNQLKIEFN